MTRPTLLRTFFLAATLVTVPMFANLSAATLTTFTDRPTFLAAASGVVVSDNLNSIVADMVQPADAGLFSVSAAGTNAGSIGIEAFDPSGDDIRGLDRSVNGTTYLSGRVDGTVITLDFDSVLEGFAFEGESTQNSPVNLNIAGQTVLVSQDGFFGVLSDMPFNQLTIDGTDGAFGLDNFDFAQVAVPEPASIAVWALLGLAGFTYCLRGRWKK